MVSNWSPLKGRSPGLPTGKDVSLHRLNTLARKLEKSGTINDYDAIIREQLDQGVIERAPDTVVGEECYIPHKPVMHGSIPAVTIPPPPGQYPRDLYFFSNKVVNSPPPEL